ncbi:hypothetical protein DOO78_19575 [Roseicella frigidaeris]|uniref:Uncharacterized protein n=1 Tax=Roseicella frigidaeris TaxID=2230885 RepID=A0A327M2W5_9PROT|nr:hypothetical protein DOO78_19575 [Roseicella frigidaeris]
MQRAYARGAQAAAELLAGPDMLSSDAIAERLGMQTGLEVAADPRRAAEAVALARRVGGGFSPGGA